MLGSQQVFLDGEYKVITNIGIIDIIMDPRANLSEY